MDEWYSKSFHLVYSGCLAKTLLLMVYLLNNEISFNWILFIYILGKNAVNSTNVYVVFNDCKIMMKTKRRMSVWASSQAYLIGSTTINILRTWFQSDFRICLIRDHKNNVSSLILLRSRTVRYENNTYKHISWMLSLPHYTKSNIIWDTFTATFRNYNDNNTRKWEK